ncbi:MAG: hypothetical protein WA886_19890, partial [Candidatus Acidiferrales bacterium]
TTAVADGETITQPFVELVEQGPPESRVAMAIVQGPTTWLPESTLARRMSPPLGMPVTSEFSNSVCETSFPSGCLTSMVQWPWIFIPS